MRKLKLLMALLALLAGGGNASAYQTPEADGIYYLYNTGCTSGETGFMSTGNNYGFQVVVDKFGFPLKLISAGADNTYQFQFIHHNGFLSDDGFMYSDGGNTGDNPRARTITVQDQGDGTYKLLNTNNSKEIELWYDHNVVGDGTGNRKDYLWQFFSKAERDAIVAGYTTSVKLAAATSMGMPASVDTESEFDEYLSTNYVGIDQSSKITNGTFDTSHTTTDWSTTANDNRDFNIGWGNEGTKNTPEVYQGAGYLTHTTITVDKVGLYKVSANALYRCGYDDNNNRIGALGYDGSVAYLQANSNFAKVDDWYSGKINGNGPSGPTDANNNYFSQGKYLTEVYVYVDDTKTIDISLHSHAFTWGGWLIFNNFKLTYYGDVATSDDYNALNAAISAKDGNTLGFETGEYAPYNNVAVLTALKNAKAINQDADNAHSIVVAATEALGAANWSAANASNVACVYNGDFSQGDWGLGGWTRTNNWGKNLPSDVQDLTAEILIAAGASTGSAYFNQPGSLQYGNAGVYTMPLKANTIYNLTFKYASWETDSNNGMTVSVLNNEDGMAAMVFPKNNTLYSESGAFVTKTLVFVTGAAGDYVLTLANNGNTVMTDVSITKAANQYLNFADGSVPSYAPGTYPSVKITRALTAGRWATAVYPFAVSGVDNIAVLSSFNAETGSIRFETASESVANQPFLMRSASNKSEITLNNIAVSATTETPTVKKNEASLIGAYSSTAITNAADNYVLSNNMIYAVGDAGATINPYRAYIQIAGGGGASRSLVFLVDDEETTAIEGLNSERTMPVGNIYNLNGQLVRKNADNLNGLRKGIYIVGGKRITVK